VITLSPFLLSPELVLVPNIFCLATLYSASRSAKDFFCESIYESPLKLAYDVKWEGWVVVVGPGFFGRFKIRSC
jgi:hypothetical protein